MAEVKGTIVKAWLNFLEARYGRSHVASTIQALDPTDRSFLSSPLLDSTWYPMELQTSLGKLTRLLRRDHERNLSLELGRHIAEYAYTTVYARQLKDDPIKQAERFGWLDRLLYQGLRECETEVTGPSSILVRYRYSRGYKPGPGECSSIAGFICRQIEMAGASRVKFVHDKCLAAGVSNYCEFSVKWATVNDGAGQDLSRVSG